MNQITIIGNLTADPDMRATQTGKQVCNFTVAVNRRFGENQQTDFFRVSAWEKLGTNCKQFLAKGRKVAVSGSVSAHAYTGGDGTLRAQMEITASTVEFLSASGSDAPQTSAPAQNAEKDPSSGFSVVQEELPF